MGALVGELAGHLAEVREVHPGRRWAPEIVYLVIDAAMRRGRGSPGRWAPGGPPGSRPPG